MATPEQLERRHRLNELMDIYGELLTDRQRLFMDLHIAQDLSFGEIADHHQVSRQAVHDSVKHAEMSLENFENKLHLLEKSDSESEDELGIEPTADASEPLQEAISAPTAQVNEAQISGLREIIEELKRSGGVIYNADEVASRLEKIKEGLVS